MKRLITILLTTMVMVWTVASDVVYVADDTSIFPNPERGFTDEISGKVSDSKPHLLKGNEYYFDESGERENQRLVVVLYNLYNYRTKPLSAAMLKGFGEDMQVLRDKGFKCVLRFAYSESDSKDATLSQVQEHISQLKPYLAANADVIYVLQAGFVGEWGEWYYSENFGNETQHLNSNRRGVLQALIDAVPKDRFLLVRYPLIKIEYLGDEVALTSSEAFTNTARAKIGHHNDAFLNDWGDEGTYSRDDDENNDDPVLRQFIADETLYVPNGGETNIEDSILATKNATYEKTTAAMARYHWSFCGAEYAEETTDMWRKNGTFDEINRRMGYRFQLISASLPDKANAGEKVNINIKLRNTGYAPLYNERHAHLVLKKGTKQYSLQLQSDPRRWLPNGAETTINEQVTLPDDIADGTYQLYLHLPDAYSSIASNPKFAIRFANEGVWNASTGMNSLQASITIGEGGQGGEIGDAIELPATLDKSNVSEYSGDMTWYNNDFFNFGPTDAENTSRWAEWKVYLRYPGKYIISENMASVNNLGHAWKLTLTGIDNNSVSTYTSEDTWQQGQIKYDKTWDLTTMPVGVYNLRVNNIMEWAQPKLQKLTLEYDGELPSALPVIVSDKTIVVNGDITIFDITGKDVTSLNGRLARGTYVVKNGRTATKVIVQ